MTSEENAEPELEECTPPLPVKVSDMKLFIALAARLATLNILALAVMLIIDRGGLYIRSEPWEYEAELFRH